jgi:hypothetical protein
MTSVRENPNHDREMRWKKPLERGQVSATKNVP